MKRWIFFLLAAVLLTAISPARAESDGLPSAGSFALGGVGVAGTMSAGERALREILKKPHSSATARRAASLRSIVLINDSTSAGFTK